MNGALFKSKTRLIKKTLLPKKTEGFFSYSLINREHFKL